MHPIQSPKSHVPKHTHVHTCKRTGTKRGPDRQADIHVHQLVMHRSPSPYASTNDSSLQKQNVGIHTRASTYMHAGVLVHLHTERGERIFYYYFFHVAYLFNTRSIKIQHLPTIRNLNKIHDKLLERSLIVVPH